MLSFFKAKPLPADVSIKKEVDLQDFPEYYANNYTIIVPEADADVVGSYLDIPYCILEEFNRENGKVWTIASQGKFLWWHFWDRLPYITAWGQPMWGFGYGAKKYDNLEQAKGALEQLLAWLAVEREKKMRRKFRSRIVFPIFVIRRQK